MKRIGSILVLAAVLCGGLLPVSSVSASVNDFYFSDFQADYYLSKDNDGRSALKVVEQLTAEFPYSDQNKGIERVIPTVYDGHSVSFRLDSLTRNGQPEPIYSQDKKGGNIIIGTGTDSYVQGTQVYQLTYTLRDVTKNLGNHQEFYWDTNGTNWSQPFDQVTARVHLDPSLQSTFTGDVKCIEGVSRSTTACVVDKNSNPVVFSSNGNLKAGENVTVVLGFSAGTFTAQPWSVFSLLQYIPVGVSAIAIILTLYVWQKFGRSAKGKGTIVPEYLPPEDISVLLSGELYGAKPKAVTAQIIDLAVRHKLQIVESEKKGLFGSSTNYTVKLLAIDGLGEFELSVIDSLFGSRKIGETYQFEKTDVKTGQSLREVQAKVGESAVSGGYRIEHKNVTYSLIGGIAALIVVLIITYVVSEQNFTIITIISIVFGVMTIALMLLAVGSMNPLSVKGRDTYDYLKGLKMYIKLAEADRIRVLQSPRGAERTPVDTTDSAQIVKLYERVLPYAVLFGLESEWAKELAIHYGQSSGQPDWYSGRSAFNAAVFASSVSNFSSTATSYSSPSSSSSSGLGGGGFSGGGGGGGGGGGR